MGSWLIDMEVVRLGSRDVPLQDSSLNWRIFFFSFWCFLFFQIYGNRKFYRCSRYDPSSWLRWPRSSDCPADNEFVVERTYHVTCGACCRGLCNQKETTGALQPAGMIDTNDADFSTFSFEALTCARTFCPEKWGFPIPFEILSHVKIFDLFTLLE